MAEVTPPAKRVRRQDSAGSLALSFGEDPATFTSPYLFAIRAKASEIAMALRQAANNLENLAHQQPATLEPFLGNSSPPLVTVCIESGIVHSFCNANVWEYAAAAAATQQYPMDLSAPDTVPGPAAKCAERAGALADAPTCSGHEGSVSAGFDDAEEVATKHEKDGPGRPPIYDHLVYWTIRQKLIHAPQMTLKEAFEQVNILEAARLAREEARGISHKATDRKLGESTLRKRVKTLTGVVWSGLTSRIRDSVLENLKQKHSHLDDLLRELDPSQATEDEEEEYQEEDNNNDEEEECSDDEGYECQQNNVTLIKQEKMTAQDTNGYAEQEHTLGLMPPPGAGTINLAALKMEPRVEGDYTGDYNDDVGNWFEAQLNVKPEPVERFTGSFQSFGEAGFESLDDIMRNSTQSQEVS